MAAFKNKDNGTWYVQFRYTDWRGERQQKLKRGFPTKKAALAWEREFLMKKQADLNMTLESFVELYTQDVKPKLKLNTWLTKESIIQKKILPYLGKRKLSEITPQDIFCWQNEIRQITDKNGKPLSTTYLKTIHNQMSAIFNHAVRFYGLQSNPAAKAGSMGEKESTEMQFWTKEEFLKVIDAMMDSPIHYYAFEILYWCGLRIGELFALTPDDFNFEAGTVTISKSYQRIKGEDVITCPKTKKSNRVIQMPQFLSEEIQDYIKQLYGVEHDSRLFPLSKHSMKSAMEKACKATSVKAIRLHDLRHSHVSLLIDMGFSALAIAERVGHESIDITYRYAHLFPTRQTEMAVKLNNERIKELRLPALPCHAQLRAGRRSKASDIAAAGPRQLPVPVGSGRSAHFLLFPGSRLHFRYHSTDGRIRRRHLGTAAKQNREAADRRGPGALPQRIAADIGQCPAAAEGLLHHPGH